MAREAEASIPREHALEGQRKIDQGCDPEYAGSWHRHIQHEVQAAAEFRAQHNSGIGPAPVQLQCWLHNWSIAFVPVWNPDENEPRKCMLRAHQSCQ